MRTGLAATHEQLWDVAAATERLSAWCAAHWQCRDVRVEVLQTWTRPYSQVWQLSVTIEGQAKRLMGKGPLTHPDNRLYWGATQSAVEEWHALHAAAQGLAGLPDCRVPQIHGPSGADGLLVMEHVAGRCLDAELATTKWWASSGQLAVAEAHFHRLGRWLHTYQQRVSGVGPRAFDIPFLMAQSELRLARIAASDSARAGELRGRLLRRLESWGSQCAAQLEHVACHGDFGPWNVIVGPDHCTLVDFSCARRGPRWLDPLNVVTYLEGQRQSLTLSAVRVDRLSRAFLSGYGEIPPEQAAEYQFCRAYQIICRLVAAVDASAVRQRPSVGRGRRLREWFRQLSDISASQL